jgi:hypothetical protein
MNSSGFLGIFQFQLANRSHFSGIFTRLSDDRALVTLPPASPPALIPGFWRCPKAACPKVFASPRPIGYA